MSPCGFRKSPPESNVTDFPTSPRAGAAPPFARVPQDDQPGLVGAASPHRRERAEAEPVDLRRLERLDRDAHGAEQLGRRRRKPGGRDLVGRPVDEFARAGSSSARRRRRGRRSRRGLSGAPASTSRSTCGRASPVFQRAGSCAPRIAPSTTARTCAESSSSSVAVESPDDGAAEALARSSGGGCGGSHRVLVERLAGADADDQHPRRRNLLAGRDVQERGLAGVRLRLPALDEGREPPAQALVEATEARRGRSCERDCEHLGRDALRCRAVDLDDHENLPGDGLRFLRKSTLFRITLALSPRPLIVPRASPTILTRRSPHVVDYA